MNIFIGRRDFMRLSAGAALATPLAARAEERSYRLVTFSSAGPVTADSPSGVVLLRELRQRGYTLGQNLSYDARSVNGQLDQLPQAVKDIAATKPDVVLVGGYPAAVATKAAGLPTVVAQGTGDPVATHLVDSLAHPGGVVTGIADDAATLSTKRLGLLKASVPNLHKVAMLWNKNDLGMSLRYQASAKAASDIGVSVQQLGIAEPDDFDDAFNAMNSDPPDAILMISDALVILNRKRVFDYAAAHRLPAIYESDLYTHSGGLMSYGADAGEIFTRAASMVDRIFRGTKPGDVPFEQPTRYLFVINSKTAKAIGFTFPSTVLALADEVIE